MVVVAGEVGFPRLKSRAAAQSVPRPRFRSKRSRRHQVWGPTDPLDLQAIPAIPGRHGQEGRPPPAAFAPKPKPIDTP